MLRTVRDRSPSWFQKGKAVPHQIEQGCASVDLKRERTSVDAYRQIYRSSVDRCPLYRGRLRARRIDGEKRRSSQGHPMANDGSPIRSGRLRR